MREGHVGMVLRGLKKELRAAVRLFHAGHGGFMQHAVNEVADGWLVHGKNIFPALKLELCAGDTVGRQQHGHAPEIGIGIRKIFQRTGGAQGTHMQFRAGQRNQIGAPFRANFSLVAKGGQVDGRHGTFSPSVSGAYAGRCFLHCTTKSGLPAAFRMKKRGAGLRPSPVAVTFPLPFWLPEPGRSLRPPDG